jgi:hypothetical protein
VQVSCDDENDEGEINEAFLALKDHSRLLYSAFDYLSSLGGGNVLSISSNGFASFVKDAKLADPPSSHCKQSHLDQLFIFINSQQERSDVALPSPNPHRSLAQPIVSSGDTARPASPHGQIAQSGARPKTASLMENERSDPTLPGEPVAKPKSMFKAVGQAFQMTQKLVQHGGARTFERHEWLHALVRIAIMRYVLPGERTVRYCPDVSEALRMLLYDDMKSRLPRELAHDANDFRRRHCYIEAVDGFLFRHQASLRSIFIAFSVDDHVVQMPTTTTGIGMSCEKWLAFCRAAQLIDKGARYRSHLARKFRGSGPRMEYA